MDNTKLGTNLAEVGTDLISRQAAIDALAKHEKSNGHNYTLFVDIVSECAEIIRDLPSAQPEPCEDAVSRETILKFFDGWMSALDENCHNQSVSDLKIIKRDFANLPSVTPKQRTGKWIPIERQWHCSVCDGIAPKGYRWTYCPSCGAKMEVTE